MWWSELRPAAAGRRRWLGRALAWAVAPAVGAVSGCGFALRQTPPLPFKSIALVGLAERSPLGAELREQLAQTVQVLAQPGPAEVQLQVLADRRERSVVASTTAGQVRELQLRTRFEFRLMAPGGLELIPATELMLSRDMSYSETFALAKAQEEAGLFGAMQSDIVQQVLRRLARADVNPPARPAAVPAAARAPQP